MKNKMQIEVDERGNEKLIKEFINIICQYRRLVKNPFAHVRNFWNTYYIYSALTVLLCGSFIKNIVKGNGDVLTMILTGALLFALVTWIIRIVNLHKMVKKVKGDTRKSKIVLDETGVGIEKEGSVLKVSWEKIKALREFDGIACFIANDVGEGIVSFSKKYLQQIEQYIKENEIDIQLISN